MCLGIIECINKLFYLELLLCPKSEWRPFLIPRIRIINSAHQSPESMLVLNENSVVGPGPLAYVDPRLIRSFGRHCPLGQPSPLHTSAGTTFRHTAGSGIHEAAGDRLMLIFHTRTGKTTVYPEGTLHSRRRQKWRQRSGSAPLNPRRSGRGSAADGRYPVTSVA